MWEDLLGIRLAWLRAVRENMYLGAVVGSLLGQGIEGLDLRAGPGRYWETWALLQRPSTRALTTTLLQY